MAITDKPTACKATGKFQGKGVGCVLFAQRFPRYNMHIISGVPIYFHSWRETKQLDEHTSVQHVWYDSPKQQIQPWWFLEAIDPLPQFSDPKNEKMISASLSCFKCYS